MGSCGGLNLQRGVAPCKQQLGGKGSGRSRQGRESSKSKTSNGSAASGAQSSALSVPGRGPGRNDGPRERGGEPRQAPIPSISHSLTKLPLFICFLGGGGVKFTISEEMAVLEENAERDLFLPCSQGSDPRGGPHLHILLSLNWKGGLN